MSPFFWSSLGSKVQVRLNRSNLLSLEPLNLSHHVHCVEPMNLLNLGNENGIHRPKDKSNDVLNLSELIELSKVQWGGTTVYFDNQQQTPRKVTFSENTKYNTVIQGQNQGGFFHESF